MARMRTTVAWIVAGLIVAGAAAVRLFYTWRSSTKPVVLIGAVLRDDSDPRKQSPLANATLTVISGSSNETAKSDSAGLFHLRVHPGLVPGRPMLLRVQHTDYKPAVISATVRDHIYIVRLEPRVREPVIPVSHSDHSENKAKPTQIRNVRLRYSLKTQKTVTVGSLAKQFEVVNTGNVLCNGERPCSPDGKWKASIGRLPLDAQKGNEFRNVRVTCIAGPCPFTRLESSDFSRPAQKIEISALNWSDTASFLVEAEVTSTKPTESVVQSYPYQLGQSMTFALPAGAEGLSIIADLNGEEIVFPLGPNLLLSWATCSVELAPGRNKIYRCELKPGYEFPP